MSDDPRPDFARDLARRRQVIGVLHVPPLPGAPAPGPPLGEIIERVLDDARAYAEGGADALLLENFGDTPFDRGAVEPQVLTLLTRIGLGVRATVELPLGVNVLRNDAAGALAVAAAVGGAFVRVNVLAGAVATDQGVIQGRAAAVLRYRARLGLPIAILADVDVKHGTALWGRSIADRARDLVERAHADALIVTGAATGEEPARQDLDAVGGACPGVPVLVGSGLTAGNADTLLAGAQGAIVGTAVKRGGRTAGPVEVARVRELVAAARQAWSDGPPT